MFSPDFCGVCNPACFEIISCFRRHTRKVYYFDLATFIQWGAFFISTAKGMEQNDKTILIKSNASLAKNLCLEKTCYGLGHVYNDLCAAIWFSYMLFYFQIVLKMESATAGSLIMIGQVVDSLATPASGWAIDRIGHPKAWHLAGTICVTTGFTLIFSINPNQYLWWYVIALGFLVILFQIGWAIVQISHLSIIPILANDYEHSSDLTTIRYTASVLSNITVYFLTWLVLGYNQSPTNIGPDDFMKFKVLVLSTTIIGIVASIIFYVGVQWHNRTPTKIHIQSKFSQNNNEIVNNHFLKSFSIYLVSLMYMSSRLYTVLNLIYIPLFLEERAKIDQQEIKVVRNSIAIVPLVSFCSSFIASIFLNCKSKFVNDKIVYCIGSIFCLAGSIWIAIGIPLGYYNLMYAVVCLTGIGSSATMVSSLCLTAQFVKINGYQGGSIYSTVTFTDKLISGVVVFLIQYLQCNPKELCPNYYEHILAYACNTAAFLGMISLFCLHYRTLNVNKN